MYYEIIINTRNRERIPLPGQYNDNDNSYNSGATEFRLSLFRSANESLNECMKIDLGIYENI